MESKKKGNGSQTLRFEKIFFDKKLKKKALQWEQNQVDAVVHFPHSQPPRGVGVAEQSRRGSPSWSLIDFEATTVLSN